MTMGIVRAGRCCLLSAIFLAAEVMPVAAQDSEPTDPDSATVLDPITVTARRRGEPENEVPLSITVIEGDALPTFSIDPGADIARNTPNFNFVDFAEPGNSFGNIRGIGPLGSPLNSLDNSVGFSVNGVATSSFGFAPNLLDVERVEVLRGPQGTLFGRNALGGAVNVVTNPADGQREFRLTGEVGTDGYLLGEALAAGWLLPGRLAARGIMRYQDFDGDVPNAVIGGEEGRTEIIAGRGTLRLTPGAALQATLSAGFDREDRNDPRQLLRSAPDFPVSGVDIEIGGDRELIDSSLEVTRDFEAFTLTSLTGFQNIELNGTSDDTDSFLFAVITGFPSSFFNEPTQDFARTNTHEQILSQEIRLNSLEDADIGWVAGLNYFRSDFEQDSDLQSNFFATINGDHHVEIDSQTFAVFGDASVPLPFLEKVTVSGGVRVAHDVQDFRSDYVSNGFPGTVPNFRDENDFSDTYATGRFALSYQWTPDIMTYASLARGYASGGFPRFLVNSPLGNPEQIFRPSTVWTYEAGIHAGFLNRRVQVDASLFFNDVSDGQLSALDPSAFVVSFQNQDYETYGFEVEARALVTAGLELNGGVGVTRTSLKNVAEDATTGAADGNRVPNSADLTANASVRYRLPGEDLNLSGDFLANGTYQFVGAREADIANSFKLDAYHLVDAQVGWESDHIKIYGFARNLFDERPQFFGSSFGPGAEAVVVGRGRTVGVGASVTW